MKAGSRTVATLFVVALLLPSAAGAQETQTEPSPITPPPAHTQTNEQAPQGGANANGTQQPAPVERHAAKPSATAAEPVAGPLGKQDAEQPVNAGGPVDTIRVRTRLVNVALNVVDARGAPVGGFDRSDFRVFEDGLPQTIAVFEREAASPLSIVLAIDASETVMSSERLERDAAKHFVRAILRRQDELDLMAFADTVREIVPFTNDARRIEQGLGDIRQGEETALYNAIYLASDRLASDRLASDRLAKTSAAQNRRRVLVLISDGGDSVLGGVKYEQAVEEAQRADAIIYSIIIVPIAADAGRNTGGEHTLIQMSEDTGGKYYYVVDPRDLEPAFQHISDDLRTQYLLGYYAPERPGDVSFRRIKVQLAAGAVQPAAGAGASADGSATRADGAATADAGTARAGYTLRYRTGYYPDAVK